MPDTCYTSISNWPEAGRWGSDMNELSCEQCLTYLPEYVAHQLADAAAQQVEQHVSTCARCQAALREWLDLKIAISQLHNGVEPPFASQSQTWNTLSSRI